MLKSSKYHDVWKETMSLCGSRCMYDAGTANTLKTRRAACAELALTAWQKAPLPPKTKWFEETKYLTH